MRKYLELLGAAAESRSYYPLKGLVALREHALEGRMRLFGRVGLKPADPPELFLRVIRLCNLRCKMCGQWGESGRSLGIDKELANQALDVGQLERLLDRVQHGALPLVVMEGGEALLHPQIREIVAMLKRRGLHAKIVTNAVTLKRHAEWMAELGLDALSVSIDGSEAIHDEIRGVPGTFRRVIAGLERLRQAKAARRTRLPMVQIATTMTRHNFGAMEQLCDDLAQKDLGIGLVMLKHPIFIPRSHVERYEMLVRSELGVEASSARGFLDDYSDVDLTPLKDDLARVLRKAYPFEVAILPRIAVPDTDRFYDYEQPVAGTRCAVPWLAPTIEPDGEVYPCNEFPDVSMGNIYRQDWREIWHGERYQAFRRLLLRGLLPICNRCCQLTGA